MLFEIISDTIEKKSATNSIDLYQFITDVYAYSCLCGHQWIVLLFAIRKSITSMCVFRVSVFTCVRLCVYAFGCGAKSCSLPSIHCYFCYVLGFFVFSLVLNYIFGLHFILDFSVGVIFVIAVVILQTMKQ